MIQKLDKIHPLLPKMTRFFMVSFTTVFVELGVFWLINSGLRWHYTLAVTMSLAVAMLANWYGSRLFVFTQSTKKLHHEFALILVATFVTWLIQLSITAIAVEWLDWHAMIGKVIALGVCFFWNFWFRHTYIFK